MSSDPQYAHKRVALRTTLVERLNQSEFWYTADGRAIRPADMEPQHRQNTIAWLERHAQSLHFQYTWSLIHGPQPSGEMACDAFDSMLDELEEQDPLEWLNEQPLMQALRQAEADAQTRSVIAVMIEKLRKKVGR